MTLPPDVVAGYLTRLGLADLAGTPPSVGGLTALANAHVERVSWETAWIHEGHAWDLDPATSAARIAATGRGGYCYHLNGGFSTLLTTLGYRVTRHVGGVHGPDGPDAALLTNHLALVVSGLPSEAGPDGRWYVDVGMGDAFHGPAPLVAGPVEQPPFTLGFSTVADGGVGDWHLAHGVHGAFVGMSFHAAPTEMDVFAERHAWLSTAPESNFVRLFVVQRRTSTTAEQLRWCRHTVVTADGPTTTVVDDRTSWLDLLADGFGIVPAEPDLLWEKAVRAHEEWAAAQG